ncbi:MAG: Rdx family protein [Candidatus Delongbacteria bacterium]|nr:Rdx family protein [Candidatus Delongbacteria bacterium]
MEKEILETCKNAEIELIEKGRGIFQITLDGKSVFDKYTEGRFPDKGEMEKLLNVKRVT